MKVFGLSLLAFSLLVLLGQLVTLSPDWERSQSMLEGCQQSRAFDSAYGTGKGETCGTLVENRNYFIRAELYEATGPLVGFIVAGYLLFSQQRKTQ